jgi:RNA polymerase sigma-70 factor (ECF subfamily)
MTNDFSNYYNIVSDSFLPDSEYSSKELEKAIDLLDDDLRLPFKMHYAGYRYQEIATALDVKLGTIKSRIFFARKKLREQVIK